MAAAHSLGITDLHSTVMAENPGTERIQKYNEIGGTNELTYFVSTMQLRGLKWALN